ncbi:MAG: hypothetical protein RSB09_00995 [Clostridia bacterium]
MALLTFISLMLIRPDFYILSARRGLSLYATTVLPALFPFFFCTTLLTKIGGVEILSKLGKKPISFLFNSPPEGAYVFFLATLSGYPTGAAMIADLYDSKKVSTKQARSIFSYSSTSGPIFMLGTVGSAIFNDFRVGIIVLVSHYLASILNGLIFRLRKKDVNAPQTFAPPLDSGDVLQDCISKSTLAMLSVGGYIVLAGMLIDTLSLIGLDATIMSHFPAETAQSILSFLYGMIEMTRGSLACAKIENLQLATAICAFCVTFGGLSVLFQSATFMSRCKVKFYEILLMKTTQATIAFILAFLIGFAFT